MTAPVHASLAAVRAGGAWRGVLLRGASGAGKSDLLLRLLDDGWRLVADDRVALWASGGRLWGRSPPPLSGLVELRGQGMVHAPPLPFAEVALVAELREPTERQPPPGGVELAGVRVRLHALRPFDASAPARLRRLAAVGLGDGAA